MSVGHCGVGSFRCGLSCPRHQTADVGSKPLSRLDPLPPRAVFRRPRESCGATGRPVAAVSVAESGPVRAASDDADSARISACRRGVVARCREPALPGLLRQSLDACLDG